MNADADDDQGDDGEPERFDPAAEFAAWQAGRPAALAKLADNDAAIKSVHRKLSALGVLVAVNPFAQLPPGAELASDLEIELDDTARAEVKRLSAYMDPKADWRQ